MARGREDELASGSDSAAAGAAHRPPLSAFGWQDGPDHGGPDHAGMGGMGAEHILPGLHGEERLPWLHAADDDAEAGLDPARVWAFVLTGFALLLLIVGGVWWTTHRRADNAQLADGSLITAPPGPIKVAPQDPGGKTFEGTGDSSFTVSQGHAPDATLAADGEQADGGAAMRAEPPTGTAEVGGAGTAPGAIGVQIGAFSTQLAAEAAWARLAKAYDALSGSTHRVVAGTADIGTVYGLQAVAGDAAAANALCDRLKAAGLNCQVRD